MNDRRELYKAMRSAHDGICPLCGGEVDKSLLNGVQQVGSFKCHECKFELTLMEVLEIRSWHADFHRDLAKVLEEWRAS